MSHSTMARAANDPDLQKRINAAVYSEAVSNPELEDTQFAKQVKGGYPNLSGMFWAVAETVDQAYESGILAGRGSPGYDADVVTDAVITEAVVANWPADPENPVINPTGPPGR